MFNVEDSYTYYYCQGCVDFDIEDNKKTFFLIVKVDTV